MTEIWKPIPFAVAYTASSFGRIIGKRGRELHPTENYGGYLVCDLHKKQFRVNRIICITFHGDPPSTLHHAAHKDSNRLNNHADNLYWALPIENAADLSATRRNQGENSGAALLKEIDVINIRQMHKDGYRIATIARKYPVVGYPAICQIIHRRSWKHLS